MPRIRPGHAVGVELLEGVELLAGGRERDRPADDLLHRQRRAAAGIAVELRQDHTVDLERGVERLCRLDGVLAGHRVDDEERVVGRHGAGDQTHLLHHLGVDRQAAGGVDDQHVAAEPLGLLETLVGGEDRVLRVGVHRHVDLATERAQLLDGRRTLQVGADEQRIATLLLEPGGELGGVGGLAGALQAGEQHDRRRLRRVRDLERLAAEDADQLVVDGLDDLLAGIERLRAGGADGVLADAVGDRADDGDVDVGLEQRRADLLHHLVDVGLGEATLAAEALDDPVEPVGEAVEHARPRLPADPSREVSAPPRRRNFADRVGSADREDLGDDVVLHGDVDARVGVVHRDRQIDTVLAERPGW